MRATNNGEPTGGIGHMGSTISQSWEPPMHGQYGAMLILTESYDANLTRTMGGITANGCMYMNLIKVPTVLLVIMLIWVDLMLMSLLLMSH